MAWRCTEAWLQTERSLCDVEVERLSCPKYLTRVHVPSVFNEVGGIWLMFMGRPCFGEAVNFVKGLAPGRKGCFQGVPGSGKSHLLATLAAAFSHKNLFDRKDTKVVYLGGCYFVETPMEVLQQSLGVTFGDDKTTVNEVRAIESWESLLEWLMNRPEQFYFMVDNADFVISNAKTAMELLTEQFYFMVDNADFVTSNAKTALELLTPIADRIVIVYATRSCFPEDGDTSYFPLMEGFGSEEASCFLQHRSVQMEPHLLHCTGFVPELLDAYSRGDLIRCLVGDYFQTQIDPFLWNLAKNQQDWTQVLDLLAGAKLAGDFRFQSGEGFLYKKRDGRGACLSEAMRNHASLRAVEYMTYTTLDLEQVLQAWLGPVLDDETARVEAPWNCTLAVASVLRLREVVHLGAIGESMVPRMVSALSEWWSPYWSDSVFLDSAPMAWPIISVAMYGKVFVLQAGICEDLEPQRNYRKKVKFLRKVSREHSSLPCQTYFVWIGCFGKRVKDGVVIQYGDHTDVFINYGHLDPLLAPLERRFQIRADVSLQCYYMVGDARCSHPALRNSILCRPHYSELNPRPKRESTSRG